MEKKKTLRVGYVPLCDCAPLVMAEALGIFRRHGLDVHLSREAGWATIRDKIIYDELDAAHALGPMPVTISLGLGSIPVECLTGLVLNLNGNAITLSADLWQRGVRDARTFRDEIIRQRGRKTHTLGVVFPFSSHHFLLREWLASGGIDPDRDIRIVVVPPPSMVTNLRSGHLDGYCVGEPWNSLAIHSRAGWCVAATAQLAPFHPEKVLLVRRHFADHHSEQHLGLIAALLESCAFCDRPENHDQIIRTLAQRSYLNVPADCLRRSFSGVFDCGFGRAERIPDFTVFSRHDANEPSADKAAWIINHLLRSGTVPDRSQIQPARARQHFRLDLFEAALRLAPPQARPDSVRSTAAAVD